jgi:tRNA modification GTPase
MYQYLEDTIAALATPQGTGALGIIRVSGANAIELVDKIFHGKNLRNAEGHTVHYGKIRKEDGYILDECLALVFKAPRSFTKENLVELNCHGSPYILNEVLQLLIRQGGRMARQGEFTLRAFLNGQFDLTQAEAIADLIASDSAADHALAMEQMRGGFSEEIKQLRQELIDFAALIELELDFGEEDVEFADRGKLNALVNKIIGVISRLIDSFQLGNVIKHGVSTVIAGRPNAGKSTLLNALLNEERALVTEIAGTTRDTIEESINIKGLQFRLIDTAGIRTTEDIIEKMGVDKTMEKIAQSTIVLYVFDAVDTHPEQLWEDVSLFLENNKQLGRASHKIFLANKMDLNPYTKPEQFYREGLITKKNLLSLSAKNKMNIEALKDMLYASVIEAPDLMNQTIVNNSRHYDALLSSRESLEKVIEGLNTCLTGDFIALDIRQALNYLGEITGEIHTDDLLDSIFTRFCIGK